MAIPKVTAMADRQPWFDLTVPTLLSWSSLITFMTVSSLVNRCHTVRRVWRCRSLAGLVDDRRSFLVLEVFCTFAYGTRLYCSRLALLLSVFPLGSRSGRLLADCSLARLSPDQSSE